MIRALAWTLVVFTAVFVAAFVARFQIFGAMSLPFKANCPDAELITVNPQQVFWITVKLALWTAVAVALPLLLWRLIGDGYLSLITLYAVTVAAGFYGYQTLDEAMEWICGEVSLAPINISLGDYMNLAMWRPFLYGVGALLPAALCLTIARRKP